MVDMQRLYQLIDELAPQELEQLSLYLQQRRVRSVPAVPAEVRNAIEQLMHPPHDLRDVMDQDEINAVLDEAIAEIRRVRREQSGES